MSATRLRTRRLDVRNGLIDLSHGAGGRASAQLIEEIFRAEFDNPLLNRGDDQAAFDVPAGRMVISTDGYVVSPLFFPGGDIGSLAVHGTINDVAMAGARPLHLAAGYIIEEGFPLADLQLIARSMARAARGEGPCQALNPAWDRDVIALCMSGNIAGFDAFQPAQVRELAGRGANEILTWVAALAAQGVAGDARRTLEFYEPIDGWIAGMAMLSAVHQAS